MGYMLCIDFSIISGQESCTIRYDNKSESWQKKKLQQIKNLFHVIKKTLISQILTFSAIINRDNIMDQADVARILR